MPGRQRSEPPSKPSRRRTATTPEGRESQMISLAERLAEEQLQDGSASAQVITHYLKLGSTRERLEQQRLVGEVELQKAKIESMASHQRMEELYAKAINAMRSYGGNNTEEPEDEEDVF